MEIIEIVAIVFGVVIVLLLMFIAFAISILGDQNVAISKQIASIDETTKMISAEIRVK